MRKQIKGAVIALAVTALAFTGCSQTKPDSSGEAAADSGKKQESTFKVPTDPVTLKFYVNVTRLSDLEYQSLYVEPLKKKYPYITLQKLEGKLDELIAGGDTPDLIMSDNDWHMPLKQLNLPSDLTDLIKRSNFDLNQLEPALVKAVQNLEPGQMQGIPFNLNTGAMFYNKDIFDKFGVPYMKDDMLWGDVLELSKRLTREDSGTQYIGWDPRFPDHLVSPYSQAFVDPKTGKALVDIPIYHKILDLFDQVYHQPGYVNGKTYTYGPTGFTDKHIQAMQADWVGKLISDILQQEADGNKMNWDMVTEPRFEDTLKKGRHALGDILVISNGSKYRDQAFQVIQMMTSKEMQIELTRTGRLTALNDPTIKAQFAQAFPAMKCKNTEAVYKYPPVPTPTPNIADKEVQTIIRAFRKEMALNKKDINTVLREGQEAADKKIAEMKAQ
jgi:multiple sugar transport system substrate-binding protein